MKRHPRKRATARNRAAKREPLAALRNPKPHIPAPMAPRFTPSPALDWDSEETSPSEIRVSQRWYWVGFAVLLVLMVAWWQFS